MAGENAHNTSRLDAIIGSKIDDVSWSESIDSQFASPIVTTPNHALVSTQSKLIGFDKADDKIAFSHPLPGGMAAAPAVTNTHILVPRDTFGEGFDSEIDLQRPTLYALDRKTKQPAWEHALDGNYLASVAVADDIYVQSDRESYRLTADGTIVWRQTFDQSFDWRKTLSYLRPVIGPDGVYIGHRDALVKIDRASGDVRWTRSMEKTVFPPVIASDTTVVASTSDATVGVSPGDGQVRWRVSKPPVWAPAISETIAVVSTNKELLGINPATGEQQWRADQSLSTCPPVIAGDTVFTAPGGTTLTAINAETGRHIDSRGTDRQVTWITPDSSGLLTRQSATDGALLEQYSLR
ncbi:Pyrrolo-quinoline quinone [Haladaptatus paucihalophilus DX253]|uniref:PQQ-like domain-containing protein n=1 Tax=Haladaptatus paucihalophilus DX253 TaxID=797209 RepID=E7QP52_HALPU|nr:PQQ-binding-like beta-propeller repeat protein [Haladaptatus paucihalophilus]EFW93968.1 Pyrrolo-quinoline quinone [Haladaptatus paucihalophilus DX253]SHK65531.1 PQQ-like domain-containing protein [Haladaptatus paucihalophilus DX253]